MIRLLNKSKKTFKFRLTDYPITKPQQSPMPTGKKFDQLTESEQEKVLKHPDYSKSTEVDLVPGVNEFKNDEWAEYFYKELGQVEEGGFVEFAGGSKYHVVNENIVIEIDKDGKEIRENLFRKYRMIANPYLRMKAQDEE